MKNTLTHIVKYGNFLTKKIIWKVRHDVRQLRKKPSNILRSKKAYGLKISNSIILLYYYIIVFLYVFLDPEKYYTRAK